MLPRLDGPSLEASVVPDRGGVGYAIWREARQCTKGLSEIGISFPLDDF